MCFASAKSPLPHLRAAESCWVPMKRRACCPLVSALSSKTSRPNSAPSRATNLSGELTGTAALHEKLKTISRSVLLTLLKAAFVLNANPKTCTTTDTGTSLSPPSHCTAASQWAFTLFRVMPMFTQLSASPRVSARGTSKLSCAPTACLDWPGFSLRHLSQARRGPQIVHHTAASSAENGVEAVLSGAEWSIIDEILSRLTNFDQSALFRALYASLALAALSTSMEKARLVMLSDTKALAGVRGRLVSEYVNLFVTSRSLCFSHSIHARDSGAMLRRTASSHVAPWSAKWMLLPTLACCTWASAEWFRTYRRSKIMSSR
mmetsp:Transcript_107771/g.305417  ORF Transcript_107771/g.305417 Transcript_107771/m.305417 type:complete len:319 (-) Transcript_107771:1018-1974(-)